MAADCEKKRKLIHIKVLDKKGKQFVKNIWGRNLGEIGVRDERKTFEVGNEI